jgi:YfiH family protein
LSSSPWRLRRGWLRLPSLEKKTGLFLGVTTRALGDMKDPAAFARAFRRAGLDPKAWAGGQQVHGRRVRWTRSPSPETEGFTATDGTATDEKNLALRVFAADCAPVILTDGRAAAAVHAGWRGTRKGIVKTAVALLRKKTGAAPRDLWMAVGPHIRQCCYEVGAEVAAAFPRHASAFRKGAPGKFFFSLSRVLAAQAAGAGLRRARVITGSPCTFCDARYFSFRRDKTEKRLAAVAVRRNISR